MPEYTAQVKWVQLPTSLNFSSDPSPHSGKISKGFLLSLLVDHNHRTINRPLSIKASLDFLKILTIKLFSTPFLTFQTLCRMTPEKTETRTVPFYKNKSQALFSILNYL